MNNPNPNQTSLLDALPDPFGESPFYAKPPEPLAPQPEVKEATATGPEQKTLDDWHYKLNAILEELKPFDRHIHRDLEDVINEIQTYLKG